MMSHDILNSRIGSLYRIVLIFKLRSDEKPKRSNSNSLRWLSSGVDMRTWCTNNKLITYFLCIDNSMLGDVSLQHLHPPQYLLVSHHSRNSNTSGPVKMDGNFVKHRGTGKSFFLSSSRSSLRDPSPKEITPIFLPSCSLRAAQIQCLSRSTNSRDIQFTTA